MNKLRILLIWGLLSAVTHIWGAGHITVSPIQIEAGQSTYLVINLNHTSLDPLITAYQMSLYLPEGVTVKKKANGKYDYTVNSDRQDPDLFSTTVIDAADGSILITCYSAYLDAIKGATGELIRLPIEVASTVTTSLMGSIKDIGLSDVNGQIYDFSDVNFTMAMEGDTSPIITFLDANVKALCIANWDTNGDGKLSKEEAAAVTDLGEVFKENKTITSFNELKYFTGLTTIGNRAFYRCEGLNTITIPGNVTSIGEWAFAGSGLFSISIPNSVTSIGESAFSSCYCLTSINIPGSVTSIGDNAFIQCYYLSSLTLQEGVTTIGGSAFRECPSLSSIHIPASVTDIGISAFNLSSYVYSNIPHDRESISVAEGNTKYDSREGCNALIETATNTLLWGGPNTTIPSSVTAIGSFAFAQCTMASIVIPNNVDSIGARAFMLCKNLTSVTVERALPPKVKANSFQIGPTLYVPVGSKAAYEAAPVWSDFKEIVEIEIGVMNGDLNGDGKVSITDVVMIIDVIAGTITDANKRAVADVNGDGNVTITDCVAAIDLIAAQGSAPSQARRKAHTMFSNTDFISGTMEDNQLTISLDNEKRYTAFQMIVSVPDGMTLGKATMDEMRGAGHQAIIRNLGGGQYLVAGFSGDNEELTGSSGRLLSIATNGQATGDIVISDIEFATTQAEAYYLADEVVSTIATGINEMKNEELRIKNDVYDLQGRRVMNPTKGLYIVNGKKVNLK